MQFIVKTSENIRGVGRMLGYVFLGERDGEANFTRPGRGYPRFHLYARKRHNELVFNLHLDQKKPSYAGTEAHSGEYNGELIERETARIKSILTGPKTPSGDELEKYHSLDVSDYE
ncbi:hypothetical protein HY504_02950 [Candidatus Wolfebacteria bacterium]|nr:hypothetical protein [Candidatus Wolfebacteria bacterium]